MNKGISNILGVIVVAIILMGGIGGYMYLKNKQIEPVVCTMDAKQCPDGSYVSRIPPKCEFEKCPVITSTSTPTSTIDVSTSTPTFTIDISDWKTYRNDKYGFSFKYPESYTINGSNLSFDIGVIDNEYIGYVSLEFSANQDANEVKNCLKPSNSILNYKDNKIINLNKVKIDNVDFVRYGGWVDLPKSLAYIYLGSATLKDNICYRIDLWGEMSVSGERNGQWGVNYLQDLTTNKLSEIINSFKF